MINPAAAAHWDAYYTSGRHRIEWHLENPSAELCCLLAAGVATPCRALDLGCGAGTEAVYLAEQGFQVTALDISPHALELARRLAALRKVPLATVQAEVPRTGLAAASFDFINDRSCFHVLEPARPQLEAYAREVERLLVPGGILFVRRFGQTQLDRATFESVFAPGFALGPVQEVRFRERHMPSRIAVMRRRGAS